MPFSVPAGAGASQAGKRITGSVPRRVTTAIAAEDRPRHEKPRRAAGASMSSRTFFGLRGALWHRPLRCEASRSPCERRSHGT
jgi:hypothetical protein